MWILWACLPYPGSWVPKEAGDSGPFGAKVLGSCDLLDIGAWNPIQTLCVGVELECPPQPHLLEFLVSS